MDVVAIIPARMASSRYPGKPLCDIHGMPMVEHVYRRTERCDLVDDTVVATPDGVIRDAVESFGGEVVMTGPHTRCTDRVAEAARDFDHEIVVVMQGDEPLIRPEMLEAAIEPLLADESIEVTNLATQVESEVVFEDPNNLKVVVDEDWNALYFSREPIPSTWDVDFEDMPIYKQVCAIPFRREALFEFTDLPSTPLERAESIDILRFLEHGHDVKIVEIDQGAYCVDTPEDHERVNQLMAEDELFAEYAPQLEQ